MPSTGDHLRPPALAALLALLAAQPEAINWERPRIDGNSQQHASALEKAYDTHCLWILHLKWLNRGAETRSKRKTLRPKNSSASPDLEKNQCTHAIVTALMENWSPTTQLLYPKGWLAEGGLHISVEPTNLLFLQEVSRLSNWIQFAFQMGTKAMIVQFPDKLAQAKMLAMGDSTVDCIFCIISRTFHWAVIPGSSSSTVICNPPQFQIAPTQYTQYALAQHFG